MKYNLTAIKKHIQTEGGLMGTVSTFLIFARKKIDSVKAYSILEILKACDRNVCSNVVIAGHRPAEKRIDNLIEALISGGYNVQLITNATADIKTRNIGFIKKKLFITCNPIPENDYKYFYADELIYTVDDAFPAAAIDADFQGKIYLRPEENSAAMIDKVINIIGRNNKMRLSINGGNQYGF